MEMKILGASSDILQYAAECCFMHLMDETQDRSGKINIVWEKCFQIIQMIPHAP